MCSLNTEEYRHCFYLSLSPSLSLSIYSILSLLSIYLSIFITVGGETHVLPEHGRISALLGSNL